MISEPLLWLVKSLSHYTLFAIVAAYVFSCYLHETI